MLPTGLGKTEEHNFSAVSLRCYMSLHLKSLGDLVKECHQKPLFCLVFDHERSSRTVKTTRVLGCNQRNRKRIGRERGKIAFAFCKIVFRSPESWLPKLWMKELEERKLGQQTAAVALDEVTCNKKQSLPTSVGKNTIAISFAILNSQELSSVLFFGKKRCDLKTQNPFNVWKTRSAIQRILL